MQLRDENLELFRLFDSLSEQNLQINPLYIKITGSIVGGYFLTQLVYLYKAYNYTEFFKLDSYFLEKMYMSEWELRAQKKKLSELNLIDIRYGKGKVTHYEVNIQKIMNLAVDNSRISESVNEESSELETRNPRHQKRGILADLKRKKNTTRIMFKNNCYLNGDGDNFEESEPKNELPEYLKPIAQIPDVLPSTILAFLKFSELDAREVFSSYQKNRNRVRCVNKYMLGALRQRGNKEKGVTGKYLRFIS